MQKSKVEKYKERLKAIGYGHVTLLYDKEIDSALTKIEKYKNSVVRYGLLGLVLCFSISLSITVALLIFFGFIVSGTPLLIFRIFSSTPAIIGSVIVSVGFFKTERYIFDNSGIVMRRGFAKKKIVPYSAIIAISTRIGEIQDQDGRYIKHRYIDVLFSGGTKSERIIFSCHKKILLLLYAKSGQAMSHLEDAFIAAYLKPVYNILYNIVADT